MALDELVVLGDDVNGCGVRADWAESGNEEEKKCIGSPNVVDEVIGEGNKHIVEDFVPTDWRICHENRSKSIEKFNDGVEDIFIPFMFVRQFGLPK